MLVFYSVFDYADLLAVRGYGLLEDFCFQRDVVLEFFKLQLVVRSEVPHLFELVFDLLHMLIQSFEFGPIGDCYLLHLMLQVPVYLSLEVLKVHLAGLLG